MDITIKDYRAGLDARKFKLSLPAGSLTLGNNGHINQGGEFEKRKAFEQIILPKEVYGAQETLDGIVVFGSRSVLNWTSADQMVLGAGAVYIDIATTSDMPKIGDPVIISGSTIPGANGSHVIEDIVGSYIVFTVPGAAETTTTDAVTVQLDFRSPSIYQQLAHPIAGVTMTGIVTSACYNNTAWSASTWSNGDTLVYNGSTLCEDFTAGLQNNLTPTPFAMATDLCDLIDDSGQYTTVKPVLANLYVQVTGGTTDPANNVTIYYNFGRLVQITSDLATNAVLLCLQVPFNTSNNQTATDIGTAIAAADDSYAGGGGNNLGFTATVVGNQVTINPPAVDANGNSLGVNAADSVNAYPAGNLTMYVPPTQAVFDVVSIPTATSPTPFSVAVAVEKAALEYQLVSTGVAASAPSGAVGQFSISAGGSNAAATGIIHTTASLPTAGSTITIGSKTYTFVTALTGTPYQVLIASTVGGTLGNLVAAINGGSGSGTLYSINTSVNPDCSASAVSGSQTTLTATVGGTVGNALTLSQSAAFWTLTAFSGGGPDNNKITQITVGATTLLGNSVNFNQSVSQTASDVVAAINAYSGTSGFTASAVQNVVSITPVVPGATYNNADVKVQAAGNVCIANCYFLVGASAGQNISIISGNLAANMLTATITYRDGTHSTETIAQFCARVVANINANTATSKYLAYSKDNQIWVSAATVSASDDPENIQITATCSTAAGAVTAISTINSTLMVSWYQTSGSSGKSYTWQTTPQAKVTVTGGVAPYSYKWKSISSTSKAVPYYTNKNYQVWTFSSFTYTQPPTEQWVCVVTDSAGQTATSDVFYLTS